MSTTHPSLSSIRSEHLSSSQSLLRNITIVAWISLAFAGLNDYFGGLQLTAYIFGFLVVMFFPLCMYLIVKKFEETAKFLLLLILNFCALMADLSTPFDDGSAYFFVPIGLLTLILYDLGDRRKIAYGLGLPILAYALSKVPELQIATAVTEHTMNPEFSKTINFIGIYVIVMAEIMVFIRHIRVLKIEAALHSKFSALGILSSGVAHEINNPLAIIKGKADMMTYKIKSGESTPAGLQNDVDTINRTVDRIAKIIKGLRMFTRDSSSDPFQPVPATVIVETALDLCHEKIQKCGIRVNTKLNHPLVVHGLETQLIQVLVNLLNNSRDAVEEQEGAWILIEVEADCIVVTDSGSGIPHKIVDQIMMPFFTTKQLGKGSGLGLAICKGILEHHGGELILDRKAKNTRFVMKFQP